MRILLDQGVPVPLRRFLHPHEVDTAAERGWSELHNGDLLDHAETNEYQALITTDQNLKHQQNLADRSIRILVLMKASWPKIRRKVDQVRETLEGLEEGGYEEVEV
ncbi:MAG: hypothetical protein GY856_42675 [bacterium]|nr:hypothetical protein [bacterium]